MLFTKSQPHRHLLHLKKEYQKGKNTFIAHLSIGTKIRMPCIVSVYIRVRLGSNDV